MTLAACDSGPTSPRSATARLLLLLLLLLPGSVAAAASADVSTCAYTARRRAVVYLQRRDAPQDTHPVNPKEARLGYWSAVKATQMPHNTRLRCRRLACARACPELPTEPYLDAAASTATAYKARRDRT